MIEVETGMIARAILKGDLKLEDLEKPLKDGMVTRIFCEECGRIKQIPSKGLKEVLAIRGNRTILKYNQEGLMNWEQTIIVTNRCFDVNFGGRVSFPLHCNGNKSKRLRLKIIEI